MSGRVQMWPRLFGAAVVLVLSMVFWGRRPAPMPVAPPEPVEAPTAVVAAPPSPAPHDPAEPVEAPEPDAEAEALLALAGANGVVCRLLPDGAVATARLEADLPAGFLGVATVGAGHLVLSEVPDEGEGTLLVEGFAPAAVAWSSGGEEGRCTPDPVVLQPAVTAVTGTVTPIDDELTVEVCGRPALVDEEGAFYADATPGVPCAVTARRHFGTFQWEAVEAVEPVLGRDAVLALEGPGVDGVLPLVLHPTEGALRVAADWTDGALVGKRIVEGGGVGAGDDAIAFHLAVAGAPGDVVTLRFDDGSEAEVELEALTFEDWLIHQ